MGGDCGNGFQRIGQVTAPAALSRVDPHAQHISRHQLRKYLLRVLAAKVKRIGMCVQPSA
ncbi:hypothetical protein PSCICF_22100 [Pseudomonas cichorii]|nr:hypothetical protein PSCICF_22100 [Pseudomonas cichorii]